MTTTEETKSKGRGRVKKETEVHENGVELTRDLPVRLSDAEIAMKARAREEVEAEKEEIEAEMKEAVEDFREQIKAKEVAIDALRDMVRTGLEHRPIKCITERDTEAGRIVFIRPDTGEVVDFRPMTRDERQLGIGDVKPVNDAPRTSPTPTPSAVRDGNGGAGVSVPVKVDVVEASNESAADLEDEDEPPPPPMEAGEDETEEAARVVDVVGCRWAVPESVADHLRRSNRGTLTRVVYGENNVELSHVVGEPVQVRAKSGTTSKTFDLLPSEVSDLRKLKAKREGLDSVPLLRDGRQWQIFEVVGYVEEHPESEDTGEATIAEATRLGVDLEVPAPGEGAATAPDGPKAKRGAKKKAKK